MKEEINKVKKIEVVILKTLQLLSIFILSVILGIGLGFLKAWIYE